MILAKLTLLLPVLLAIIYNTFPALVYADSSNPEDTKSTFDHMMGKAQKGITDPVTGSHLSWDRGFHWESKKGNLTANIGGKFIVRADLNSASDFSKASGVITFPGRRFFDLSKFFSEASSRA